MAAAIPLLLSTVVLASAGALSTEIPPCSPGPGKLRPVVDKRDGRKVSEGSLRGAARDGRWIFYWPSGHKKEQSHYCNGVRHGSVTFWYTDGLPELEGTFNRGAPWGTWTYWSHTGARRTFRPVPQQRDKGFFLDEGNRALSRNELGLAESLLGIALRNASRPAEVHRSLGVLHAKAREGAKAAFHYRRYIELAPGAKDRPQVEKMLAAYERARKTKADERARPAADEASPPRAPAQRRPDQPKTAIEDTVRLEVVTLPAATVVIDGVRHPFLTPLDGPRALRLKPGKHKLVLKIIGEGLAEDAPTVQHMEVTVTADDPANRVEFVPGERLTTYGAVKVRPLADR